MNDCTVCLDIINDDNRLLVYENENFFISHGPLNSYILGYLKIQPKRHIENWTDFTDQELAELPFIIKSLEFILKEELNIDRVYSVSINEAVRYIHIHIIPRAFEENIKGLPLIEQATQQHPKSDTKVTAEEITHFI